MKNPFSGLIPFKKKAVDTSGSYNLGVVGMHKAGGVVYRHYKDNQYENGYSSITKIANRFASIEPFAIDENGKTLEKNPVLDKLYHPSSGFSAYDFREALAVFSLVHDKVNIRVHHTGSKVTANNITGFTFIEGDGEFVRDGKWWFSLPNGDQISQDEVITLKSINPYDLQEGFSPSRAARRWTKLDDYIGDYEAGLFENGAVPAGQFIVRAATTTEFNDIVDKLQERHRGAGKNNNVTYTHEPLDAAGKPQGAQIQWVPFNTTNKDLNLDALFEQANKKIDSAYGVPSSIRAVNDSNTYASVRIDQAIFIDETVRPFTLKIWSKFTHELNRITGGLGAAITFELETPHIAEEEKLEAETKTLEANLISKLVSEGYTLPSIVESFDLPARLSNLKMGKKPVESAPITEDEPEVDDDGEVENAPDGSATTKSTKSKQISSRDYPDLYKGTDIDPDDLGCIMIDTEKLEITKLVEDGEADLVESTDRHDHAMSAVAETEPHITLLYGLLENGNVWKDKVDAVLKGWSMKSAIIEEVSFFDTPDSYAVIAHIKKTPELIDGHERLTLLPHIQTFSEYLPHMTLAYIKKDADVKKWVKVLGSKYNGKKLKISGINYGDKPEESKSLVKKELSPESRSLYESQVAEAVRYRMSAQIQNVIANIEQISKSITATEPIEKAEDRLLADAMMAVLATAVSEQGAIEHGTNLMIVFQAGFNVDDVPSFALTPAQAEQYREYLEKVATSYNAQTGETIRNILEEARVNNVAASEIKNQLSAIMQEEYRIKRIAVSEVNKAGNEASLRSMQNIAKATGAHVEKTFVHRGGDTPCGYCQAMIGTTVDLDEPFLDLDQELVSTDGSVMINSFDRIDTSDIHPNGHCGMEYQVRRR